jgi:phosphate transport system permease protein
MISEPENNREPVGQMFQRGEHFIWLTGAALAVCLLMITGLLVLVLSNGMGFFWPHALQQADLKVGGKILGAELRSEQVERPDQEQAGASITISRSQFKVGNRDLTGADFKWVLHADMTNITYPKDAITLERLEYGDFFGFLAAVKEGEKVVAEGAAAWELLQKQLPLAQLAVAQELHIQKIEIGHVNHAIQRANLAIARAERRLPPGAEREQAIAAAHETIKQQNVEFEALKARAASLNAEGRKFTAVMRSADGRDKEVPLANIVRAFKPNEMSLAGKLGHYGAKLWEFVAGEPRESNTEGGVFPAIFGTVMMTILMSIAVVPFGVLAALYLREYAQQGPFVRAVRIALNNLAGVPSIVFGVFGLGFFVYFVGGTIDQLFYPESLPTPTYGTGGIMWASLTLALLTVPVVIVATEESIAAVPRGAKEGSLALGASKFQTLCRIVLPASLPGILTGLILAMARGAGEVAPLMITGVVKLAPDMPFDSEFPFFHLDRKFMHLGFHIYDVGFQSPNVEAAKPMVFATTLLLLAVVVALNLAAILLRDRIRKKYRTGAFA